MRPPLALLALALLVPPPTAHAQADPRVAHLARQLTRATDARVRTQSALMLGAADDPEALGPLCRALGDPSELVRTAAAKALATLREPGALECLRPRARDASSEARSAVLDAMRTLEAARRQPPRFYLAFGGVADRTSALTPELMRSTEARLRRRLAARGALLAPANEAPAAAQALLKRRRLKGYRLRAEVHPAPAGGLRLALVCMTYPDQMLLGQVDVKATGAQPADLLRALASRAVEEAAETFEWSE